MPKGKKVVGQDSRQDLPLGEARRVLSDVEAKLKQGQSVRVNVSWVIEEEDAP